MVQQNLAHSLPKVLKIMNGIENRVIIEDCKRYSQHLRNTSVRRGEIGVQISTVVMQPSSSDGFIETATFRTKGIDIDGREGEAIPVDRKMWVPLLDFSGQFALDKSEVALEFHSNTINDIASLLEEDPLSLERIELHQLEH